MTGRDGAPLLNVLCRGPLWFSSTTSDGWVPKGDGRFGERSGLGGMVGYRNR